MVFRAGGMDLPGSLCSNLYNWDSGLGECEIKGALVFLCKGGGMIEECEFCGKEAETEGTSVTGAYCIDCLRLTQHECSVAIKQLQERKRGRKTKVKEKVTKEQYDNALAALRGGPQGT